MSGVVDGVRLHRVESGSVVRLLGACVLASALIAGGCEGSGGGGAGKGLGKGGSTGRREPMPGAIVGNPEKGDVGKVAVGEKVAREVGETSEDPARRAGVPKGEDPVRRTGVPESGVSKQEVSKAEPGLPGGGVPASDRLAEKMKAKVGGVTSAAEQPAREAKATQRDEKKEVNEEDPARTAGVPKAEGEGPVRRTEVPNAGVTAASADVVVAVKPGAIAIKQGTIAARVGERDVAAALWFVHPEFAAIGSGGGAVGAAGGVGVGNASRVREWIGTSVVWRTSKSAPKQSEQNAGAPSSGFWVAAVSVPEGGDGAGVEIDRRRVAVMGAGAEGLPRVRRVATSAFAREMLSGLRRSPMVRWRARLAAGEPLISTGADHAADLFADATLEGLARTTEREWSGVLARLNAANAELASRFASRLAGVVDIGEGVEIPVWPADANSGVAMESLLSDLLRAGGDRDRAAKIAEAWLAAQPVGGAVVIDDAAAIDLRSGLTFPSVLLANLSDQPAAAIASRVETAEPEMLRLEPFAAVFASVGAAAKVEEGVDPRRRTGIEAMRDGVAQRTMADVRVGDWRGKRAVVGEIAKIRPPGMDIGPLLSDWTQQTFLAAAMDETPRGEMQISGSVSGFGGRLKPADDQGGAAGPGRWLIMFEIVRPQAGGANNAAKEERSELVLSFGPRGGTASQTLRVLADGSLYEVRNGQAMAAGNATLKRSGDRTFYWVPVPSAAIEAGKVLRLGLVRIDERGRRSAWPRPMLPWQTEPGRIAVDLSSWSPVKE